MYTTKLPFTPWNQIVHEPPVKRLTFTLDDARIELMQFVHDRWSVDVKMGNLYVNKPQEDGTETYEKSLTGTYRTWDELFERAYGIALQNNLIRSYKKEDAMNITHDIEHDKEAYLRAHPHHSQLLKEMEKTEKETKDIVREIVQEKMALMQEVKEKIMSVIPFPVIPTLPDKKDWHQVTQKQTYADWNIRIYATDKPIAAYNRYIVLLKHKDTKTKQWYYPKDRGFLSIEEAYAAAIICIAHKKNYILFRFQDCELLTVQKNEE